MKNRLMKPKEPSCTLCKDNYPFDLPAPLLDDFFNGNVAIFAGSGVSTESKQILPETLYESIAAELGYKKCTLPFSDLMEEYCKQPDGRIKLLFNIKSRFDNIRSFPELYRNATRFHQELSTLPQIKTIITTNWDTYFEDECGAIPFINDEDFAFWETGDRRVIKIHGSIGSYGSIVATKNDYKKRLKKLHKGMAGSILKTILATKTIVYIGYSFSDEDFQQIHTFVRRQMKDFSRQAYIVTLDDKNLEKYKRLNLTPIVTDGTYFIRIIKEHSVHIKKTLPDFIYDYASDMLKIFRRVHDELHKKYNCVNNPEITYCSFYQDGAIHAYERVLALRNTGRYSYSYEFIRIVDAYKKILKKYTAMRCYGDIAYLEGYMNAHMYLLFLVDDPDGTPALPLYYAYGYKGDINTIKEYSRIFKQIPSFHRRAYAYAQKIVKKSDKGGKFVMHHPAYL